MIRLVDQHGRGRRQLADERFELTTAGQRARGVVRIADVDQRRRSVGAGQHSVEVMCVARGAAGTAITSAPRSSAQRPIRSKVGTAVMTFLPGAARAAAARRRMSLESTPDHDLFRQHAMHRRKSITQVRRLDVRKTVREVCGALLNRRDRARRRTVPRCGSDGPVPVRVVPSNHSIRPAAAASRSEGTDAAMAAVAPTCCSRCRRVTRIRLLHRQRDGHRATSAACISGGCRAGR